jgi:hypothetical protein
MQWLPTLPGTHPDHRSSVLCQIWTTSKGFVMMQKRPIRRRLRLNDCSCYRLRPKRPARSHGVPSNLVAYKELLRGGRPTKNDFKYHDAPKVRMGRAIRQRLRKRAIGASTVACRWRVGLLNAARRTMLGDCSWLREAIRPTFRRQSLHTADSGPWRTLWRSAV